MATSAVAHSISGMKGLAGVGGAQLATPARGGFSSKRDRSDSASTRAIRAHSGKYCSSSSSSSSYRGLSQSSSAAIVVPVKSDGSRRRERVLGGAIRAAASGGDEFRSGRASFPSAAFTDGVQFLDSEQMSVVGRRNSGSAINSVSEDQNVAESQDDSAISHRESEPSSDNDIARPQPIVQGFADSPFVGEFALDLTAGSVGSGGVPEFDSMAVSVPYRPKFIWFAKSPEQENMFIDRAINATIVGSAGILAVTKMLTVDHDYWHVSPRFCFGAH